MPDHRDIRTHLAGVIAAVDADAIVHEHVVPVRKAQDLVDRFGLGTTDPETGDEEFAGWEIAVIERPTALRGVRGGEHNYVARLMYWQSVSYDGSSELAFWDHVEAVADAINEDATDDALADIFEIGPADVEDADTARFKDTLDLLAHFARVLVPFNYHRTIRT